MIRKQFIASSEMAVTSAMLPCFAFAPASPTKAKGRRPDPHQLKQAISKAPVWALNAPNPQAWKFRNVEAFSHDEDQCDNGLLNCGEDYTRLQFFACANGFYMHLLRQILQKVPSMKNLHAMTLMINVTDAVKAQIAMRIGRSEAIEYSYRRNIDDFETNTNNAMASN